MVDTYENEGQWEPVARLVRPQRDKRLVSLCRQFPVFVGENIDQAAKLYGHVDLYRIYVGDGLGVDGQILDDWDVMRKAKAAGKVRAIGISTHSERMMTSALQELEGLDYVMFPYNFIHARADYSEFLPAAIKQGVGLIAIKPLAAGSIVKLDPRARPGSKPENERIELYQARSHPLLPAVVDELTKSLTRLPDESLCQAALRFVYSRPFMTCAMLGPATFGSNDVDFGWMVDASQKVPWPGKRPLRGRVAQAEAEAAYQDIEDTRLRLAEAAKLVFFDYFLVHREQEINADNVRIMQEFRNIAQTKYESNLVPQQDVLQAEVDLADLARRRVELERMNDVAIARINTLLHRVPDHPLPAPPKQIDIADGLPPADTLRKLALERRPDLAAQAARIRAEEAAVELACKEFYPDLEFVARYDAFWQPAERDLRPQIGMNLNLPIQRDRRRAAVAEAVAKVTQRRSELDQRVDEIQNDVQASVARLNEAKRVVALYTDSILPAAQKNIESAQAGYVAGRVDFLRLIEAQRQLINYREKQYEAIADFHRRMAELKRVLAVPVSNSTATRDEPTTAPE